MPLYNEAPGLAGFHENLIATLAPISDRYEWQVVYVVDPSTDGTALAAKALAEADARVASVIMLRRAGHQMSLIAGMARSRADVCVTMDGDGQHPPTLIPAMLELNERGYDVVQTIRVSTEGQGIASRTVSRSFYGIINRLSDVQLVPGGADYRLMSRRVVDVLTQQIGETDRFLRGLIPWLGLPTATLEFVAPPRSSGESKFTLRRSASLAVSGVVSMSKVPLRIGIGLGILVSAIGLIVGVAAVIARLAGSSIPAGWTTVVVLLAVLSGAQLVALGLIGTYLGVIFDEVKRRPTMLVDEVNGWCSHWGAGTDEGPSRG